MIDLPHNIEAEQAVLGGLMSDPAALAQIADWLLAEHFYRKDHQLIYRAIVEIAGKGGEVDGVSVGEWFEANRVGGLVGGLAYVAGLHASSTGSANIKAWAEIVLSRAKLRELVEIGNAICADALSRGADTEKIVAVHGAALNAMHVVKPNCGLMPTKPFLRAHMAEMNRKYEDRSSGLAGIPTPWLEVNRITKGLRKGVIYIVPARPSMGKSVFGCQLSGFCALRGVHTALFTVEMGAEESLGRMISCFGEIPHTWIDLPDDGENSEIYWSRYASTSAALSAAPLVIDDQTGLRIEQVKARARREHLKKPLELIVLDHVHDMDVDPKAEYRREIGKIIQGGKDLGSELGCAVVFFCQLNRALQGRTDKRPTMTDLRESGEIEQKADVILALHREEYYDPNTHLKGVVEVIPIKGRNLLLGKPAYLQSRFDQMRMEDWDGPLPEAVPVSRNESRGGFRRNAA